MLFFDSRHIWRVYDGFRLDKCTMTAIDVDLKDKNHSQGLDDALHQLRNSSCSIAFHHGIENVDNTFVFTATTTIHCGLPNDPPNPMGNNCSWCFLGRGHLVLQEKPRAAHRTSSISTRWLKKKTIFVNFEACNNALYITM